MLCPLSSSRSNRLIRTPATGIDKNRPTTPAIFAPTSKEKNITTGFISIEPCITRGMRTFSSICCKMIHVTSTLRLSQSPWGSRTMETMATPIVAPIPGMRSNTAAMEANAIAKRTPKIRKTIKLSHDPTQGKQKEIVDKLRGL